MADTFSAFAKRLLCEKTAAAFGFSEVCEKSAPDCCRLSFFASLILFGTKTVGEKLVFSPKNEALRDLFGSMAAAFYSLSPAVTDGGVVLSDDASLGRVLQAAGMHGTGDGLFFPPLLVCGECLKYFLRGAFLCHGTVSEPEKRNQLNLFLFPYCEALLPLLRENGLGFRISARRGKTYLYLKSAADIEDFFTCIGAERITLALMDRDIEHLTRANVNRQVNCDAANGRRTGKFVSRLRDAVALLEKTGKLELLPKPLYDLARVCRENPDAADLADLGALIRPPLSRSGIYHRARSILDLAEKTEVSYAAKR